MIRFIRGADEVDAMLFDGSPARAKAIISSFAGKVSRAGEDCLEVDVGVWSIVIGAGMWVVRDVATRVISVVDDRVFFAPSVVLIEAGITLAPLASGDALLSGMIAP